MSNARHPLANGVDLEQFAKRAAFDRLTEHYGVRANQLRALGLNADVVLLTTRFEVLLATLAQIAGVDGDALMYDVERQAVERCLDRFDQIEPELRKAREQHTAEGFLK